MPRSASPAYPSAQRRPAPCGWPDKTCGSRRSAFKRALISSILLGVSPVAALAASSAGEASNQTLGIGLSIIVHDPGYLGVGTQTTVLPRIHYRYKRLFVAGATVGFLPLTARDYSVAIVVKPRVDRLAANASSQLQGIHSRKPTLDGGVQGTVHGSWGRLTTGIYADLLRRSNGVSATLAYALPVRLGPGTLSPSIRITRLNSNFTAYYYGVSPDEASATLPAYRPGVAVNTGVGLRYHWPLAKRWSVDLGTSYTRYDPHIANSPLIDRRYALSGNLGLMWRIPL